MSTYVDTMRMRIWSEIGICAGSMLLLCAIFGFTNGIAHGAEIPAVIMATQTIAGTFRNRPKDTEKYLKKNLYKFLFEIGKVLTSKNRIEILRLLYQKPHTFSELMRKTLRNPKAINDDLKILIEYDFVRRTNDGKYGITELGKLVVENESVDATLNEIKRIIEIAINTCRLSSKKSKDGSGGDKNG